MCTPSTASRARPTTSPTIPLSTRPEKLRRLDRMGAVLDGAPRRRRAFGQGDARQPRGDRHHGAALPRRAARLQARRDQAALPRLGRSDGVLPLFGLAGGAAIARSARREPRHLAAFGRAVQRAAGAEPSPGLRRRLQATSTASICPSPGWPRPMRGSRICAALTSNAGLRRVFDRLLDGTDKLIAQARALAAFGRKPGLAPRMRGHRRSGGAARAPAPAWRSARPCGSNSARGDFALALLTGLLRGGRG